MYPVSEIDRIRGLTSADFVKETDAEAEGFGTYEELERKCKMADVSSQFAAIQAERDDERASLFADKEDDRAGTPSPPQTVGGLPLVGGFPTT
jgi:hypothetical protein